MNSDQYQTRNFVQFRGIPHHNPTFMVVCPNKNHWNPKFIIIHFFQGDVLCVLVKKIRLQESSMIESKHYTCQRIQIKYIVFYWLTMSRKAAKTPCNGLQKWNKKQLNWGELQGKLIKTVNHWISLSFQWAPEVMTNLYVMNILRQPLVDRPLETPGSGRTEKSEEADLKWLQECSFVLPHNYRHTLWKIYIALDMSFLSPSVQLMENNDTMTSSPTDLLEQDSG